MISATLTKVNPHLLVNWLILSPRKLNLKNFFPNLKMCTCIYSIESNQMQKKLQSGVLNQESMYKHINKNKPSSGDVCSHMCTFGCLIQLPESIKLLKFSLLIPPSTSGIGCGFSAVDLIITPLQTNHNKANRILICVFNWLNPFSLVLLFPPSITTFFFVHSFWCYFF